jgi:diguanylate cyclase (GGDEF)-like protein
MIDAPTLVLALALDDVVLAAALWVAIPGKQRYGVALWSASLLLQAVSFLCMWNGGAVIGPLATIIIVNAGAGLSVTFQLAALHAVARRPFPRLWHVAIALAVTIVSVAFSTRPAPRLVIICLVIAGVFAIVTVHSHRLSRAIPGRGARLLALGALAAAVVFASRSLGAAIMPSRVIDVMHTPWTPLSVFAGHAVTLAMSLGFLLLHRERQEHEIERLAMTDELTAVYNRRSLFELGEKEVSRARRTKASLSALLLDLDHFKRVNDKYGHLGGDAVLVRFVEVVRGCLRTSDILSRYGGEEFLVLLPDVGSAGAKVVADRIRATVEASTFFVGAVPLKITASVGVASLGNGNGGGEPTLAALIARSDQALYIAKRDGRNRVAVAKAA